MTNLLFKKIADMRKAEIVQKIRDYTAAWNEGEAIRLFSRRDVIRLFPDGTLSNERFAGMTVSFVVYAGWPARANEPEAYANLTE